MMLAALVLAVSLPVGLLLVLFGLPGLWVMVLGVLGYGWLTAFRTVSATLMGAVVGLALAGEIAEWWLGFRFAQRYGGSRRAGWGALFGGLIGAAVGVPVPVVGSIVGAFAGAFAGAALFEFAAVRAGYGALLGRAAAAATKIALGVAIAVLGIVAALRR
jgi:uncharacterized protein YqgC (DUF456 family)